MPPKKSGTPIGSIATACSEARMVAATMHRRHRLLRPTTVRRPLPTHRAVGLLCLNDLQLPQTSPCRVGSRHSVQKVSVTPPSSLADRHSRQRPPFPIGTSREQHRQRPSAFLRLKSARQASPSEELDADRAAAERTGLGGAPAGCPRLASLAATDEPDQPDLPADRAEPWVQYGSSDTSVGA